MGETVADVSKRFGVAASTLIAANNLQSHEPSDGDRLVIPAVLRQAPVAASRTARAAGAARHASASVSARKGKAPGAARRFQTQTEDCFQGPCDCRHHKAPHL